MFETFAAGLPKCRLSQLVASPAVARLCQTGKRPDRLNCGSIEADSIQFLIVDEGFVIVTRAAKAKLLESSRAIGQMARAPKADSLEAEWKKVQAIVPGLLKTGK